MREQPEREKAPTADLHGEAAPDSRHLDDAFMTIGLTPELERLRTGEPWGAGGRHAKTLVKADGLRVVLIALRAGARLDEHHAPGRITIQTLSGEVRVSAAGRTVGLAAGDLLSLGPALPHDVEARTDSAILLTIAWPEGRAGALPLDGD